MPELAESIRVVDADAHMTERHDLFTERAPKGYEDKVPHVEDDRRRRHVGRRRPHVRQGGLGRQRSTTTARSTRSGRRRVAWGIGDVHPAAWDPAERLKLMDELGIYAQVLYPNSIGIGGQNLVEHGRRSR